MTTNEGLKRRVLRDDVVEHIVDSILNGALKPGDKIVETRISRELHVSQGAVREAIRDLTARGFVETEAYKGSRVRVLSAEDMQEYFAVRRELEPIAVSWAYKLNAINIEELYAIVDTMNEGVLNRDVDVVRKADLEFHRKIIEFSGNSSLVRSWEALANDYWIYTIASKEFSENKDMSGHAQDHKRIVEAIDSGDLDLMKDRLQSHFISEM
ncbi:GntR family transcriptional regulator [Maridesulfovibrio hydrothermalis]|uniref:Transcriptional regulator, GntR family n=1 Tax=Maridesulfovibrio hydrothermalis AM13 = DSM 14728 TaxID=1121451 RepID=L0RGM2_9BACT|nr:GntR family transcriptional regulator [Maridesulfovibrio hydrothermalis]CCO25382.1 Transcriptional regulator, GntR family [Maridesulfovibrio hydrothermalis AM13 = DSM 14728]